MGVSWRWVIEPWRMRSLESWVQQETVGEVLNCSRDQHSNSLFSSTFPPQASLFYSPPYCLSSVVPSLWLTRVSRSSHPKVFRFFPAPFSYFCYLNYQLNNLQLLWHNGSVFTLQGSISSLGTDCALPSAFSLSLLFLTLLPRTNLCTWTHTQETRWGRESQLESSYVFSQKKRTWQHQVIDEFIHECCSFFTGFHSFLLYSSSGLFVLVFQ